jgi:hypothetical protein
MTQQHDQPSALPPAGPPPAPYVERPARPPRVQHRLGLPVVAAIAAGTLVIGGLLGGIIGYAVHADGPDLGDRQGLGPGQRFPQGGPPDGSWPDRGRQQDGSES